MFTNSTLTAIFARTAGHCHFCGDKLDFANYGRNDPDSVKGAWEVDHVIQRGKGGTKRAANCLPACIRCNRLRWHRRGRGLRELLLLGLIAKDEIKKDSALGKTLLALKKDRLRKNKGRRRSVLANEQFQGER